MKVLKACRCHPCSVPVLVAWVVLFGWSQAAEGGLDRNGASALRPAVDVVYSTTENATHYTVSADNCTLTWIARKSEIGVIKHRSRCAAPLAGQIRLLEQLYGEFLRRDTDARALRTLFWGRLEPEMGDGSRELSLRLALAAHRSPDWDARLGRPRNGDLNGFVKELANSEPIYPELKEVFGRFQKTLRLSYAEKVRVSPAGELPFFEQLAAYGVKAVDRLPFDCMAWFAVTDEAVR